MVTEVEAQAALDFLTLQFKKGEPASEYLKENVSDLPSLNEKVLIPYAGEHTAACISTLKDLGRYEAIRLLMEMALNDKAWKELLALVASAYQSGLAHGHMLAKEQNRV